MTEYQHDIPAPPPDPYYWLDSRYTGGNWKQKRMSHDENTFTNPDIGAQVTLRDGQITWSSPTLDHTRMHHNCPCDPLPKQPTKGNHHGMQNQETHHLEPPENQQENIKIEEEGKQMSKCTQRIAWNDLKPGDTIHVCGTSNTYTYKRGASRTCGLADSVWAAASPLRTEVVIDRYDFNYATRKPERSTRRHTRVQPPQTDGEYYLASIPVAPENKLLMELMFGAKAYTRILRASNARNRWRVDLDDGTWREYATWGQLLGAFDDQGRDVTAALTADEFYQRKYKQAA
jgi:hypothetical protein